MADIEEYIDLNSSPSTSIQVDSVELFDDTFYKPSYRATETAVK